MSTKRSNCISFVDPLTYKIYLQLLPSYSKHPFEYNLFFPSKFPIQIKLTNYLNAHRSTNLAI